MKVLDLAEFYSERGGGVRAYLSQLIREGTSLGHSVSVVAPGPRDERSVEASSEVIRLRGPSLPYDPTYHLLWNLGAVARAVRSVGPDVLEISSPYAAALMATQIQGVAVKSLAVHSDFIDTHARPVLRPRIGDKRTQQILSPAWAYLRALTRSVDVTVVSGQWLADKLRANGCVRVECVPFGISRQFFGPEHRDETLRRELLGPLAADPRAVLVVVAGRLAIEKRVAFVIDALLELSRRRPLALLVLGDGPERRALEQHARSLPVKHFLGFVTDRERYATLLASADVLVHGCPHETFGFVVAEALASGVPVVVPQGGGAAEFAKTSCSATYSADGTPLDCAVATERLLQSPPEHLRREAVLAAATVPSAADHFRQLFALYERVLHEKRR